MTKKKSKSGSGSGSSGAGLDDAADRKRHEQPLQAVLLADDWFSTHNVGNGNSSSTSATATRYAFYPLTLDRPKVLCPLLNATMIDYVMNYLATQGVQELYVVCVTEAVEEHLLAISKTNSLSSTIKITVIRDGTLTNAGDALRELDKRNVIYSDPFVLLHGDCIANINLAPVIAQHKARHVADSSAIFTMIVKAVGATNMDQQRYSPLRSTTQDLVIGMDVANHNRILLYDNNDSSSTRRQSTSIPCSFFASHVTELVVRTDLLDVGIDLCSPDVLARFSDEFDYRDIRAEFVVNSVAEEEEGLQNKLYAYVAPPSSYAARIVDVRTYHAISRDVLRRHAFPVVPDNMNMNGTNTNMVSAAIDPQVYAMQRHFLYCETTGRSRVGRSSSVSGPGMIGAHCFIGENCRIQGSVLSAYCHVASGCHVQDSYLWDGVQVESGATISQSVLACGVVVKAGAVVSKGCIIGAGCVIGTNVRLPEYTRLTCSEQVHDEDNDDDWGESDVDEDDEEHGNIVTDDDEPDPVTEAANNPATPDEDVVESDFDIVGADGKGRLWQPTTDDDGEEEDDDDEENVVPVDLLLKSQCIGFNPLQVVAARFQLQTEEEDDLSMVHDKNNSPLDGDDDDYMDDEYADGAVTFDGPASSSNNAVSAIIGRQEGVDVVKELKIICLEFEAGTSPIENLAIELNSYKFSQNATYSDCTMAAMLAILEKMTIFEGMSDGKLVAEFKSQLDKWAPLLQKMSVGLDEEKAIVLALEQSAVEGNTDAAGGTSGAGEDGDRAKIRSAVLSSGMSFRLLLQMLHDQEIVSEEAILAWAADREDEADKDTPKGRLFRLQPVQDFLEWLDEESDDDEEEDEDDEEE